MSVGFRVLTVEDNEILSVMLSVILAGDDFTVCSAGSGREAIEALAVQTFDLMLIDIQMPAMDGFTLLETLRADHRAVDVPVLMLTASTDLLDVQRARALGARGFLSKPFEAQSLVKRVRRLLESPDVVWIDDHHCLLQPVRTAADASGRGVALKRG